MRKAINHLKVRDEILKEIILQVGPCKLGRERHRTPYEALAESIAYQQLAGAAAKKIWGRVVDIYDGRRLGNPESVIKTPDQKLREAGFSYNKIASLKDLASHTIEGVVPSWRVLEKLEDDEIIERLTTVRGIGPWTVQMLLIFQLARLDVLPSTDFGVQKGFQLTYKKSAMPNPKQLEEYAELWRPYRSVASWYLWRAIDIYTDKNKPRRS